MRIMVIDVGFIRVFLSLGVSPLCHRAGPLGKPEKRRHWANKVSHRCGQEAWGAHFPIIVELLFSFGRDICIDKRSNQYIDGGGAEANNACTTLWGHNSCPMAQRCSQSRNTV